MKPNYELAKLQQDFKDFYDKNLRQKYKELEPARQKYLNRFWRRFIISLAIILLTIYLCATGVISKQIYDSEGFVRLSGITIVVMFFLCSTPFTDYCTETKLLVMDKILSFWGTFNYSHISTVSEENIKKSELFPQYNCDDTDDSFSGTYKNTEINVAEKDLQIKGNKHNYTIFKGVIIELKFNKRFKGKTVVKNRGSLSALWQNNVQAILLTLLVGGIFGALLLPFYLIGESLKAGSLCGFTIILLCAVFFCIKRLLKHRKKATQKVKLEEILFNKNWEVLTSNQVEARYILTPVFMEKINNVKTLFHGKRIDFSFFNSKLMIAVHTSKDQFETTSLFTPALDYTKVREVVSQFYSIFSVIDVLNGQK